LQTSKHFTQSPALSDFTLQLSIGVYGAVHPLESFAGIVLAVVTLGAAVERTVPATLGVAVTATDVTVVIGRTIPNSSSGSGSPEWRPSHETVVRVAGHIIVHESAVLINVVVVEYEELAPILHCKNLTEGHALSDTVHMN